MGTQPTSVPAGWDRRPDGTLVRRDPAPFSVAWLSERAVYDGEELVGFIDPGGKPAGSWVGKFHTACGYATAWHIGGRCPSEAEARAASGAQ